MYTQLVNLKISQLTFYSMLKLEDIYDVTVAKDGQEAYEKVKASMEEGLQFNLIFMDVQVRFQTPLNASY